MRARRRHGEQHRVSRSGWLRAAVLGANDGIVSTASLLVGMAAAQASANVLMATGVAGLVAGAMSMAAGEYVSVHSQADIEAADLARERAELAAAPAGELQELAGLYQRRGLSPALAQAVAAQLTHAGALAAHARDELGQSPGLAARPVQAALTSAASFALGAAWPLLITWMAAGPRLPAWIAGASLAALALLGSVAAVIGGAPVAASLWRVSVWGALAMAVTGAVGWLFGIAA